MPTPLPTPPAPRAAGRRAAWWALLASALVAAACGRPPPAPTGTFVEEFEGFPIYHAAPGRPYDVLGTVPPPVSPEASASAVKRAAVADARRLGADAILLRPSATPSPPATAAADHHAKWSHAVAIRFSH